MNEKSSSVKINPENSTDMKAESQSFEIVAISKTERTPAKIA